MVWKKVFHGMENVPEFFPWHGKIRATFSTAWKKVFHSVEKWRGQGAARVVRREQSKIARRC
jgi:beta-mannanase